MRHATATPYGKTYPEVQRETVFGYCNPSLLAGAFLEEIHGHGVTLAPFGTFMCVKARALSKHAHIMVACLLGVGAPLAKVFGAQLSIDNT